MTKAGIRDLKNNLSRYVRRIEAGDRIAVTAHGRVVAELHPPVTSAPGVRAARYEDLVASGVIRPPLESGDPLADWPVTGFSPGLAAELIDEDRGKA